VYDLRRRSYQGAIHLARQPHRGICEAGGVLFAIQVSQVGLWSVVAVTGELELGTAPRLRQQVVSLVGEGRRHLVVDLAAVDFVDSLGLGVLVSALKRVRAHGGELRVAGPSPRVRSLFELTRLEEIIEVHDSVAAAVAAPFRAADDPLGELGGSALDAGESTTIGEASERHG
jgi:anti-sigma B factor antagonist